MKRKRVIKRRNRLEGQIAKAAATDAGEAVTLATFGHNPTPAERAVWKYLSSQETKKNPETIRKADHDLGGAAYSLCQIFLDAVDKGDGNAIREMAKAAENPQLYQVGNSGHYVFSQTEDWRKREILSLKRILDHAGEAWTVKQLAGFLAKPFALDLLRLRDSARQAEANAPESGDSHAALRYIAKSLKFPLAKDRIGAPKKSEK